MSEKELSKDDVDSLLGESGETPNGTAQADQPAPADEAAPADQAPPSDEASPAGDASPAGEGAAADAPAAGPDEAAQAQRSADAAVGVMTEPSEPEQVNAQPVEFSQLTNRAEPGEARKIDFLLDVPVTVTVELGRTSMVIRDALSLGGGSVVELNKLAGEPVDVLINNKLVARAEVVVVNENFGVKVIDIVSPEERLRYLR